MTSPSIEGATLTVDAFDYVSGSRPSLAPGKKRLYSEQSTTVGEVL